MSIVETAVQAAKELADCLGQIREADVQRLTDDVLSAKRVYFAGAGRSLIALRGVAMRFMHVGIETYVAGDTTTPAFEAGDLLIAGSGSGETAGIINMVTKAKAIGGKTALFTIRPNSTMASLCNPVIIIPAYTDKVEISAKRPVLPGGSQFEQALLLLGDTMILRLAQARGVATDRPFARHANLE
ncbi:MAG: SIS domain-containing protein [Treponema sp.]|jgi:6-phospho-3-hexuloisomerase|nr:SIS domain-containing protein [Treponema sp.]